MTVDPARVRTLGLVVVLAGLATAVVAQEERLPVTATVRERTPEPTANIIAESVIPTDSIIGGLFRVDRSSPHVRYDPAARPRPTDPNAEPPRAPDWRVNGVVLGTQPVALIAGMDGSGVERVVAPGDTVGSFVIQSIHADSVIVQESGLRWTLPLSASWTGR